MQKDGIRMDLLSLIAIAARAIKRAKKVVDKGISALCGQVAPDGRVQKRGA
jgi:hypothetical protein